MHVRTGLSNAIAACPILRLKVGAGPPGVNASNSVPLETSGWYLQGVSERKLMSHSPRRAIAVWL